MLIFIGIIIFISIVCLVIWKIILPKRKRIEDKRKGKIEPKINELYEIDQFNTDEYFNEVFNTVFYSIQNDSDWIAEIEFNKIKFTKKKDKNRNHDMVTLTFSYKFELSGSKKIFTIESTIIKDESNYQTFEYKLTLPNDIRVFTYKIYSDWINKSNLQKKEKADKALSNIKSIIGVSSERGAKIDELLK